jgi:predicted dehydrogenase
MPRTLRIALNGVTGRMGFRQHFLRSILPIRDAGGVRLDDGSRVAIEPVLVGRDEARLRQIAQQYQVAHWSTDLSGVLADPSIDVYFDAQITACRFEALRSALLAGKAVYTEKPTAATLDQAIELARLHQASPVTAGVVHDKVYLPGLLKLRRLVDEGFFGRLLSLRGEFGYWVFEGDVTPGQRPSWNYRRQDGGGVASDMFCHWNYVLETIVGRVDAVTATVATHIPTRWDEAGQAYAATAEDAAYAIFELTTPTGDPVIAQINSSWAVRVHRDELVEFQVDGTAGSAVAGLFHCVIQPHSATPRPVWDPDLATTERYREQWLAVPDRGEFANGFKAQWEEFLADVAQARPHRFGLASAARGVALAEAGLRSSAEGRRVALPDLGL